MNPIKPDTMHIVFVFSVWTNDQIANSGSSVGMISCGGIRPIEFKFSLEN